MSRLAITTDTITSVGGINDYAKSD